LVEENSEIYKEILPLLRAEDQHIEQTRGSGIESVVIEAALAGCHKEADKLYVGEVAELANAILRVHGDKVVLNPREVGEVLRLLGLPARRLDQHGRGWRLSRETCRLIHQLAQDYRIHNALEKCTVCKEVFGSGSVVH
jgi:hypothetical protein